MSVIQLRSGRYFDLHDPRPEMVDIVDIAHSLSHLCRFNGHTEWHYSVAQHSFICSYLVEPQFALEGLLHDAHEAYIGDISRPVRNLLGDSVNALEARVQSAISHRFGVPEVMSPEVRKIDNAMLGVERRHLLKEQERRDGWPKDRLPEMSRSVEIKRIRPEDAFSLFLERYAELSLEVG